MRRVATPWRTATVVVLALVGVAAFGFTPGAQDDDIARTLVSRALQAPRALALASDTPLYWREERVQRGDTIGSLLARAAIDDDDAMTFMRTDPSARPLYRLHPGKAVHVAADVDGRLMALRFRTAEGQQLTITRGTHGFDARQAAPDEQIRITLRAASIESSLFAAADDVGLPDAVTLALAEIFAGDIDFYHDLRRGDRFVVVYETRYIDGEPAGTGRVLAAEFINRGVARRAFLWRSPDGREAYYNDDGRSNHNAFLRSPMEFSRITSGFTQARFHPILHIWKAHRGTDFAAPVGTPVRATADGTVAFVGQQTGYGNVVILKHDGAFSTVYGHLSRFAPLLRVRSRVAQGDTIAYVGQTGWATGPHLHYEFRVAGEARDPMSVGLPVTAPIDSTQRAAFDAQTATLSHELAVAQSVSDARVAAAE